MIEVVGPHSINWGGGDSRPPGPQNDLLRHVALADGARQPLKEADGALHVGGEEEVEAAAQHRAAHRGGDCFGPTGPCPGPTMPTPPPGNCPLTNWLVAGPDNFPC